MSAAEERRTLWSGWMWMNRKFLDCTAKRAQPSVFVFTWRPQILPRWQTRDYAESAVRRGTRTNVPRTLWQTDPLTTAAMTQTEVQATSDQYNMSEEYRGLCPSRHIDISNQDSTTPAGKIMYAAGTRTIFWAESAQLHFLSERRATLRAKAPHFAY